SVRAKPSHWIERISPAISGWRVVDSMTAAKMLPMPTPAPTAPRPPPTPSAIARPALVGSALAARWVVTARSTVDCSFDLVRLGDGAAEVDGSEGGEDERLQAGDQHDLKHVDDDADRQRDHADRGDPEQDRQGPGHEQDDQVAGEDVGEQS